MAQKCLSIAISFYRNIVRGNVACEYNSVIFNNFMLLIGSGIARYLAWGAQLDIFGPDVLYFSELL